jgi:ribosomal protein S18 acetylase RimI-like enzyme
MFEVIKYSGRYEKQYCDLYIATWRVEPYGEAFTSEEIMNHLGSNEGFLYLLIEEESDKVIGFVGGRAISHECDFFINEASLPIDIEKGFYVDELGIEETHKMYGWGQLLMSFLISSAREKGFSEFVLRTHADHSNPAIGLYYKLGMKPRRTNADKVHGVETTQRRIDGRPETDFRIYFYKTFQ